MHKPDVEHLELHVFEKGDTERGLVKLMIEHMPLALTRDQLSHIGLLDESVEDL